MASHTAPEGVIIRHLDYLRTRNMRRSTIYNRQRALARIAAWSQGPILYLSEDDLKRWQHERARQIQPEPLRTEMSHARNFYRWAVRERYIDTDPMERLDLPRVARRLPRPIGDHQLADALAGADPDMAAILALAAFSGLRAIEIAKLDWAEVGIGQRRPQLRIVDGKGGHGRLVPISSMLTTVLLALPHRRGPVIRRLDGRPGQNPAHRISQRANDYLHSLGIEDTLHQCRHRFATHAYQACRDIRAVQDLLGHASPATTAVYAAAASQVARDAVESAGTLWLVHDDDDPDDPLPMAA
jgi:integrase/recombinase XerC